MNPTACSPVVQNTGSCYAKTIPFYGSRKRVRLRDGKQRTLQAFQEEKQIVEDTLRNLRSGKNYTHLLRLFGDVSSTPQQVVEQTGIQCSARAAQTIHAELRYAPYLEREAKEVEKAKQYTTLELPADMNFTQNSWAF